MLCQLFKRSISIAAADLADPNAIKTTIATAASIQTYTTSGLNGSTVTGNTAYPRPAATNWAHATGELGCTSWPSATASSAAGSFVDASTIQFIGTYRGAAVTRTATVVGTDGGATFIADGPMDTVTSIVVAAQVDTAGAWTFGWSGLGPALRPNDELRLRGWIVKAHTAGNIHIETNGEADTVALAAMTELPVPVTRIYADTAVAVTILEI